MPDFSKFEKKINIIFKDKALLKQAFIHRSYLNENPKLKLKHNERLEFLGDAVLELVVTEHLFSKYNNKPEGELTSFRAALVNSKILSQTAFSIEMNEYLLLSRGEARDTGKARQFILADTFEALIGAIYLDQGYNQSRDFIAKLLFIRLDEIVEKSLWRDAKSFVQEKAQELEDVTPSYKVLSEDGPDHNKGFLTGIFFGDELIAKGEGKSKQEAEQKAAQRALAVKGWE